VILYSFRRKVVDNLLCLIDVIPKMQQLVRFGQLAFETQRAYKNQGIVGLQKTIIDSSE